MSPESAPPVNDHEKNVAAAWTAAANVLASWANSLINQPTAYGRYLAKKYQTPRKTAVTEKKEPTIDVLKRHFQGIDGARVGLHTTSPANTSWFGVVDIDRHGDDGDPDSNFRLALHVCRELRSLGLTPLLIDSNGRGGFHIWIFFAGPAPTADVEALLQWAIRGWKPFVKEKPECFPRQGGVTEKNPFGNWIRLPGSHPKHPHYSRVWDFEGERWLEGKAAIDGILFCPRSSPAIVPDEVRKYVAEVAATPKRRAKSKARSKAPQAGQNDDRDLELAADALQHLDPDYCKDYDKWLNVGFALCGFGQAGLKLWNNWSKGNTEKYDPDACADKWATMVPNGGINLGSLFAWAKECRWEGLRPGTNGHAHGAAGYAARPQYDEGDGRPTVEANGDIHTEDAQRESCSPGMEKNPHRLARLFLGEQSRHPDGLTWRYWQGEFHVWTRAAYRKVSSQEIRAELTRSVAREFERLHEIAIILSKQARGGKATKPPQIIPVTTTLISDVLQALASLTILKVDQCKDQPAWVDRPTERDVRADWPAHEVLPTKNAYVHLPTLVDGGETGAIIRPTPAFFGSYALNYEFDREPPSPVNWLTFLGKLPVEDDSQVRLQLWPDDFESIDFLQEWFGYHLERTASQQKALALIGPLRSGKGTIAFMLGAMIGHENVAGPTLTSLSTQFGLQSLIGMPCAIVDDARLSGKTDVAVLTERLLTITGQGKLNVARKNLPDWVGTLSAKFTIITNETPRLPDSSGALPGRLMFLHLTESFFGREDHKLKEKLLPELPGILLWAIKGWQRLRERGHFTQPRSGQKLANEMKDLASPIGAFVKDVCTIAVGREVSSQDLYQRWKWWCELKGREHPGDEQGMGRNLRSVMPNLVTMSRRQNDGSRKRIYQGIGLREPGDQPRDDPDDIEV